MKKLSKKIKNPLKKQQINNIWKRVISCHFIPKQRKIVENKTKQEIFDKVYTHLLTQNKRAVRYDRKNQCSNCCYLTPDGLSCAAGCLIPPDYYDPEIEGLKITIPDERIRMQNEESIGKRNILNQILKELGLFEERQFILKLQKIHDFEEVCEWKERLEIIAENHGLKVPEMV